MEIRLKRLCSMVSMLCKDISTRRILLLLLIPVFIVGIFGKTKIFNREPLGYVSICEPLFVNIFYFD